MELHVNCSLHFHVLPCDNLTRLPIFFEVRPIGELQDSDSSPRREEVGRHTLGAIGGFLLSFFHRDRFQLSTQHFLVFIEKLQKLSLRSL